MLVVHLDGLAEQLDPPRRLRGGNVRTVGEVFHGPVEPGRDVLGVGVAGQLHVGEPPQPCHDRRGDRGGPGGKVSHGVEVHRVLADQAQDLARPLVGVVGQHPLQRGARRLRDLGRLIGRGALGVEPPLGVGDAFEAEDPEQRVVQLAGGGGEQRAHLLVGQEGPVELDRLGPSQAGGSGLPLETRTLHPVT